MTSDDRILAARIAAGDHEAFEWLVMDHQTEVRLFISARCSSWEVVEEVVQNTFLRAYQHAERFDSERGNIIGWLKGIARNCLLEELRNRKRQRHTPLDEIHAIVAEWMIDHEALPTTDERSQRLGECIDKLKPRAQKILHARYTENLSLNSLAQHFGKKANSLAGTLHRIRNSLKLCMDGKSRSSEVAHG